MDGYAFYPSLFSPGGALREVTTSSSATSTTTTNDLARACNTTAGCVGFSTDGQLKAHLLPYAQWQQRDEVTGQPLPAGAPDWPGAKGSCAGTYVKMAEHSTAGRAPGTEEAGAAPAAAAASDLQYAELQAGRSAGAALHAVTSSQHNRSEMNVVARLDGPVTSLRVPANFSSATSVMRIFVSGIFISLCEFDWSPGAVMPCLACLIPWPLGCFAFPHARVRVGTPLPHLCCLMPEQASQKTAQVQRFSHISVLFPPAVNTENTPVDISKAPLTENTAALRVRWPYPTAGFTLFREVTVLPDANSSSPYSKTFTIYSLDLVPGER